MKISWISLCETTAKPEITYIKLHGWHLKKKKTQTTCLGNTNTGVNISVWTHQKSVVCWFSMGLVRNMLCKQLRSRLFQPCVHRPDSLHTPLANWGTERQKNQHENHNTNIASSVSYELNHVISQSVSWQKLLSSMLFECLNSKFWTREHSMLSVCKCFRMFREHLKVTNVTFKLEH